MHLLTFNYRFKLFIRSLLLKVKSCIGCIIHHVWLSLNQLNYLCRYTYCHKRSDRCYQNQRQNHTWQWAREEKLIINKGTVGRFSLIDHDFSSINSLYLYIFHVPLSFVFLNLQGHILARSYNIKTQYQKKWV